MKFKTLAFLLFFVWVFAFIISLPTLLEYSVLVTEEVIHVVVHDIIKDEIIIHTTCGSQMSYGYTLLNAVFVFMIAYVLPVILMGKNYLEVGLFVMKKRRTIRDNSGSNERLPSFHLFKHRVKLVKLLVMVAMIFVVSWLPFFIIFIYAVSKRLNIYLLTKEKQIVV